MFCEGCGTTLDEKAKFCEKCGKATIEIPAGKANKKTVSKPTKEPKKVSRFYGIAYTKFARFLAVIASIAVVGIGLAYADRFEEPGAIPIRIAGFLLAIVVYVLLDIKIKEFENIAITAKETTENGYLLRQILDEMRNTNKK